MAALKSLNRSEYLSRMNIQALRPLSRSHLSSSPKVQPQVLGSVASGGKQEPKSYHDIPKHRSLLPSFAGLLLSGGAGRLHEHCTKRHRELGPIYREHLGRLELVFLADTRLMQTVIANEGPYPHHNVPQAWLLYNQLKGVQRGLFFQHGAPWLRARKALNQVMLSSSSVTPFAPQVLSVTNDLLAGWHTLNSAPGDTIVLEDVKGELCKWSLEATGAMLFGTRLGCLGADSSPEAEQLVQSVSRMFEETSKFQILPAELAHKLGLPAWARFERATDSMLAAANTCAARHIAAAKSPSGPNSLLRALVALGELADDEVLRSVVDLLIAAADTTSSAAQWLLYLLARHPAEQAKLLAEARKLCRPHYDFRQLAGDAPRLRAFIRESLRLYPTAPFLARSLDKSITLAGYHIPAHKPIVFSLFTTSRMAHYYQDPLQFRPDRWLRAAKPGPQCPRGGQALASLPFGIGARMCVGRRASELQMSLLVASVVSRFRSSLADEGQPDVGVALKMILGPDRPIRLRLEARRGAEA